VIPKEFRIWIAVLVAIAVVILIGASVFNSVKTPAVRSWDYGSVPFVPAKSHYSIMPLPDDIQLPNPAATKAPPGSGGSR
jgi:hypothetical protein